jgi:ribosomal protein L34E
MTVQTSHLCDKCKKTVSSRHLLRSVILVSQAFQAEKAETLFNGDLCGSCLKDLLATLKGAKC